MSTLSLKGRALVYAGRRAFRPTDADRVRLLGELRSQLGDAALPPGMSTVATAAAAGKALCRSFRWSWSALVSLAERCSSRGTAWRDRTVRKRRVLHLSLPRSRCSNLWRSLLPSN